MSSKLSLHENKIDKLEKNIHKEVVKFTGMDLFVGLEEVEGNKGEKILLIDVIKSDFEVLKLGEFISEIVEDFYKEAVVVRLRECIEFPLSDKNNHSP